MRVSRPILGRTFPDPPERMRGKAHSSRGQKGPMNARHSTPARIPGSLLSCQTGGRRVSILDRTDLRSGRPAGFSFLLRLVLVSVALLSQGCRDATGPAPWESGDLLKRLNSLPGVRAQEIQPYYGYPRAFQLDITQPVDHNDPYGPTFTQRAYLSHASLSTPMVFAPAGYGTSPQSGQELAEILQTNCLSVTHRYFPDARPENPDWQYLNIWQAAQDHHRIVTFFKEIYEGKWISTGASKGGKTAVFHRRFFPDDVDATVAYVAPFLLAPEDERFEPYLRSRGTPEEREAIYAFQRNLLEQKDELLPYYRDWFTQNGYEYSLPIASGFEGSVVSYEWNFFQRHRFRIDDIPDASAPPGRMVDHLAQVVRLHFRSDIYRDYFKAYVYQVLTETGSPRFEPYHLYDLLEEPSVDVRVSYSFPQDIEFVYRWETIPDVLQWAVTEGDGIIYIYGEIDPWTAGAVELSGQADALKVVQVGADHGVRILELDEVSLVLQTLGDWLGMDLTPTPLGFEIRVPGEAALIGTPMDPTLDPGW